MRILHTSDWHFGRSLHGEDLSDAVDIFIDWLEECVRERGIDCVLISGDVFDRAVPPVRAVRRLSAALSRLCALTTVVAMPGNHDSAFRLGFAADLMQPQLRIVSEISAIGTPLVCEGSDGQRCLVYPIPYLEPDLVRQELAERLQALGSAPKEEATPFALPGVDVEDVPPLVGRSHQAVMDAAMTLIRADREQRLMQGEDAPAIVMVHAFITGATPSDSERDIRVGGVENIGAVTFDGFDYIAAGHLHRPQDVEGSTSPIRYAGSPVAYSFSEAATPKTVTLLEIDAQGLRSVEHLSLPCLRPLSIIRDSMEAILGQAYAPVRSHFTSITVTDDARPAQMTTRIREVFPHALVVVHEGAYSPRAAAAQLREGRSAHDVAVDFFEEISGATLSDAERDLIDRLWADLRVAERGDADTEQAGVSNSALSAGGSAAVVEVSA